MSDEAVVHTVNGGERTHFTHMFFCDSCGCGHGFNVDKSKSPRWDFNGDMVKPTLHPSLLYSYQHGDMHKVCHSFVTKGMIQYLADCTHSLAGQTVPLKPF